MKARQIQGTHAHASVGTTEMTGVRISCTRSRRNKGCRWLLISVVFLYLFHINAGGQTQVGFSLNLGNRQHYKPSYGFEGSFAPSASISITENWNVDERWAFRCGAVAGVVGYKVNVISIDTLGPNGDVSPFPEYSTFFASGELLFGRQLLLFNHNLFIGAGAGITTYLSATPISFYSVGVIYPNAKHVQLFDARMTSPASQYSLLWKVAGYFDINAVFSVGVEYVHHNKPAAEGTYEFYHTKTPQIGKIEIYQREFRFGVFYKLHSNRGISN